MRKERRKKKKERNIKHNKQGKIVD